MRNDVNLWGRIVPRDHDALASMVCEILRNALGPAKPILPIGQDIRLISRQIVQRNRNDNSR